MPFFLRAEASSLNVFRKHSLDVRCGPEPAVSGPAAEVSENFTVRRQGRRSPRPVLAVTCRDRLRGRGCQRILQSAARHGGHHVWSWPAVVPRSGVRDPPHCPDFPRRAWLAAVELADRGALGDSLIDGLLVTVGNSGRRVCARGWGVRAAKTAKNPFCRFCQLGGTPFRASFSLSRSTQLMVRTSAEGG